MRFFRVLAAAVMVAMFSVALGGWLSPSGGGGVASQAVSLPDTIFVAEGRECNLWYDQLTAAIPGAPYFTVVADCDSGLVSARSWRWNPWATGAPDAKALTLKTVDPSGAVKRTGSTIVQSVENDSGSDALQVLFIGDSMLGGSPSIVSEVFDTAESDGGSTLAMLGTQGSGDYLHEGYSGKGIRYFTGSSSPFWYSDQLDFQTYMSDNSFTGNIDFAVIQLGANDLSYLIDYEPIAATELDSLFYYTRTLVDSLTSPTSGYPACKVVIGLTGFGALDQATISTDRPGAARWFNYRENMRKFQNRMIAEFDGNAHSASVDVCAAGLWLDRTYGYPFTQTAVSARCDSTLPDYSNFLHPIASGGYGQMADAYYSHLRHLMNEYTPAELACTNELADSHNWATANGTYWTNQATFSTYFTMTAGQADPWGGTSATLFTATASAVANLFNTSSAVAATDQLVVASAIVKKTATTDSDDRTEIRIVDATDSAVAGTFVVWAATPTAYQTGALQTSGGITDLGDGWYRIWVHSNIGAGRVGHNFTARIGPVTQTVATDDAVIFAGAQLEFGVTTPCGDYVETP